MKEEAYLCFHSASHKSTQIISFKSQNLLQTISFRISKSQIYFFSINMQTTTIKSGSRFVEVCIILVAFNFEDRKWSRMNADKCNKLHICILFIFYIKEFISISLFYLLKGKQYLETYSIFCMAYEVSSSVFNQLQSCGESQFHKIWSIIS